MNTRNHLAYIWIGKIIICGIIIMGSFFSSHGAIQANWSIDQSDEPLSIQSKGITDYVTYNFGKY